MKVSVVVPTYKRSNYIKNIIDVINEQTYKQIEIVIVDDNGIGTEEQIFTKAQIDKSFSKFPVKYIPVFKNSGACVARNIGIKEATGDIIAFLDDDDMWNLQFVECMVTEMEKQNVDIIYCNFFRFDGKKCYFNPKELTYSGNVYNELLSGWCPASCSLFCIKKDILNNLDGFDENIKNLEEYDLWIRISKNNFFGFCEKRLVIKNESEHYQLSTNYKSRKESCILMREKWKNSIEDEYLQKKLFVFLDTMILDAEKKMLINDNAETLKNKFITIIHAPYSFYNKVKMLFLILIGKKNTNFLKKIYGVIIGERVYINEQKI